MVLPWKPLSLASTPPSPHLTLCSYNCGHMTANKSVIREKSFRVCKTEMCRLAISFDLSQSHFKSPVHIMLLVCCVMKGNPSSDNYSCPLALTVEL